MLSPCCVVNIYFFREIAIIKRQIYVNFCIQMYYKSKSVLFILLKFIGASHLFIVFFGRFVSTINGETPLLQPLHKQARSCMLNKYHPRLQWSSSCWGHMSPGCVSIGVLQYWHQFTSISNIDKILKKPTKTFSLFKMPTTGCLFSCQWVLKCESAHRRSLCGEDISR